MEQFIFSASSEGTKEICHWHNHYVLHNWFEKEASYPKPHIKLRITDDVLNRVIKEVLDEKIVPDYVEEDLRQLTSIWTYLDEGYEVYYSSWK